MKENQLLNKFSGEDYAKIIKSIFNEYRIFGKILKPILGAFAKKQFLKIIEIQKEPPN
ncbi:hypothetical protein [Bacillus wiedmannii]|uniref:hypothetical protein n=1 Tax=Bacillus wiedmannii TaxID=1890302 RepID=UPI0030C9CB73